MGKIVNAVSGIFENLKYVAVNGSPIVPHELDKPEGESVREVFFLRGFRIRFGFFIHFPDNAARGLVVHYGTNHARRAIRRCRYGGALALSAKRFSSLSARGMGFPFEFGRNR